MAILKIYLNSRASVSNLSCLSLTFTIMMTVFFVRLICTVFVAVCLKMIKYCPLDLKVES